MIESFMGQNIAKDYCQSSFPYGEQIYNPHSLELSGASLYLHSKGHSHCDQWHSVRMMDNLLEIVVNRHGNLVS
jgi:hypothetical protein